MADSNKRYIHHIPHILSDEHDWVVFMHGAGGSMNTFKRQIDAFKEHFNVLMLDLRDHGESRNMPFEGDFALELVAKDVIELNDNLGIKKAHFVAVSMGSIFIRMVDEFRPDMVKSIIVGGGVFGMSWKLDYLLKLGYYTSKVVPFHVLYKMLALIILPNNNHKKSREIFIQEAEKIGQKDFDRWLTLLKDVKKQIDAHYHVEVSAPTLVVMGAEDHVFMAPAKKYSDKYDHVELVVIEKCGHVCNIEKAQDFNEACLEFLNRKFAVTA